MDLTTVHMIAVASVVLGGTCGLAIVVCRTALHGLDLQVVPVHLMPRVRWWQSHAAPALSASLTVLIVGLVGLLAV